jgi:hypothetical protein
MVATFGLAGCNTGPEVAIVRGKVELDGEPLKTGAVLTSTSAGRGAQGTINANGEFELGTFAANDGALPGVHKVAIVANDPNIGTGPEALAGKSLVPQRYTNAATSGLEIEVTAGEVNTPTLRLTSP